MQIISIEEAQKILQNKRCPCCDSIENNGTDWSNDKNWRVQYQASWKNKLLNLKNKNYDVIDYPSKLICFLCNWQVKIERDIHYYSENIVIKDSKI